MLQEGDQVLQLQSAQESTSKRMIFTFFQLAEAWFFKPREWSASWSLVCVVVVGNQVLLRQSARVPLQENVLMPGRAEDFRLRSEDVQAIGMRVTCSVAFGSFVEKLMISFLYRREAGFLVSVT